MPLADTIEFSVSDPSAKAGDLSETLLHYHEGKPDQRPMYTSVPGWARAKKYREGGYGQAHTFIVYMDEVDSDTLRETHAAWMSKIGATGTVTRTQGGTPEEFSNMTLDEVEELALPVLEFAEITLVFLQ